MENIFKVKIKTIKEKREKEEGGNSVSTIDSLFNDDFMTSYFSKKEKSDK